jgi:hypothetical protein
MERSVIERAIGAAVAAVEAEWRAMNDPSFYDCDGMTERMAQKDVACMLRNQGLFALVQTEWQLPNDRYADVALFVDERSPVAMIELKYARLGYIYEARGSTYHESRQARLQKINPLLQRARSEDWTTVFEWRLREPQVQPTRYRRLGDLLSVEAVPQLRAYASLLLGAVRSVPPLYAIIVVGDRFFVFRVPMDAAAPCEPMAWEPVEDVAPAAPAAPAVPEAKVHRVCVACRRDFQQSASHNGRKCGPCRRRGTLNAKPPPATTILDFTD